MLYWTSTCELDKFKSWKIFKKSIDNSNNLCYSIKVAAENSATQWTLIIEQYINQPESSKDTKHLSLESVLRTKNQTVNSVLKRKNKPDILAGKTLTWEFDPGSGWTLAACLTHASRTKFWWKRLRPMKSQLSGGRVSNAWVTCLTQGDNS